jgi:putative endonuclease
MPEREYFVYILTNKAQRTLYTGITRDLTRRLYEHRHKLIQGFTAKYNVDRLLYYESYRYVNDAIAREKEIKGWRREKKLSLVRQFNPELRDLTASVLGEEP